MRPLKTKTRVVENFLQKTQNALSGKERYNLSKTSAICTNDSVSTQRTSSTFLGRDSGLHVACYVRKTKLHAFGTPRSCSAADFPQSQCFFNILPDVLLNFAEICYSNFFQSRFCQNVFGILLKLAEICRNSKSRRIRTHPDASGRIRDASGIGTSSAEICIWPIDPLLASSCARPSRPLSATSRSRRHEVRCRADSSVKLLQQSNLAHSRSGHFAGFTNEGFGGRYSLSTRDRCR